ncbi:hypothetical protein [Micavibrio aeruginosavorus]|nr:hypothetical protein [Micavibrio aeruginosavorus]
MSVRTSAILCMTVLCAVGLAACSGTARPQNTWTNYYETAHDTKSKTCAKKYPKANEMSSNTVCKEPTR